MPVSDPLTSIEVRWFFSGALDDWPALLSWYRTAAMAAGAAGPSTAVPEDRLGGLPDVYLLIPGSDDMGIKWREGLLQVKGLSARVGEAGFAGRHHGFVERWIKWTYAGLPDAYRRLVAGGDIAGVAATAVYKRRLLRVFEATPVDGGLIEADRGAAPERGVAVELTEVRVGNGRYCTLGFEAFPDDARTRALFNDAVSAFLESLQEPRLEAAMSLSYPGWLLTLPPQPVPA